MRLVNILGCLKLRLLKKMSGAQRGSEKRWTNYTVRSFMIILLIHIIIIINFVVSLCDVKKSPQSMRIELNHYHRPHNQSTYRKLADEKSTDLHNFRTAALSFLHVQATPNIVICAYPSQSSSCQYHERAAPVSLFVTLLLALRQNLLWPTVNMKYPFSRRTLRCSRNF